MFVLPMVIITYFYTRILREVRVNAANSRKSTMRLSAIRLEKSPSCSLNFFSVYSQAEKELIHTYKTPPRPATASGCLNGAIGTARSPTHSSNSNRVHDGIVHLSYAFVCFHEQTLSVYSHGTYVPPTVDSLATFDRAQRMIIKMLGLLLSFVM